MDILREISKNGAVIYGAGNVARLAIGYLRKKINNFDDCVIGVAVSSDKQISCSFIDGVKVRPIDEYIHQKKKLFFLVAVSKRFYTEIKQELSDRDIENYAFFDCKECISYWENEWKKHGSTRFELFKENLKKDDLTEEEYYVFLSKQLKNTLDFEINVTDHCNLNCQSCNHFSPIAKKTFVDLDSLGIDLQRIHDIYGKSIGNVMLLGGEPLLHPQLNNVLMTSRKFLPNASLSLVTNGILLDRMDDEFWRLMSELDISLNATVYPIQIPYDRYEKKARDYGIKTVFVHTSLAGRSEQIKTTYLMPIKEKPMFNPYQMYAKCSHANTCVVLKDGRIYTCSFAANVHHYNEYFRKNIPEKETVSIDIYGRDRNEIDEFLRRPNKMCSHCDICGYIYDLPWKISSKKENEWTGEL